jgi:hypothetical protein
LKNGQQAGQGIVPVNSPRGFLGDYACRFPISGTPCQELRKRPASVFEKDDAMSPLVTALLCFGAFVVLGLIAKVAIGMWMKRQ